MKDETRENIEKILRSCVDRTLQRVQKDDTYRPFHEALLTKELVMASAFERSFSTSFGQGPIEEISELLASANGYECERQKQTRVDIPKSVSDEITRILSALRSGDSDPNWAKEVERVCALKKGDRVTERVLSDLWMEKENDEIFISIKTVKPNIDQSERAKRDMLLLKAHNSDYQTYLGLYYNPGGPKRNDYNWNVPSKIFNMKKDICVLIGEEYWEKIGGKGTYKSLLKIFEKVGNDTRKQLENISD
jgi:hypothetical protein